jgi:hypothetical protein
MEQVMAKSYSAISAESQSAFTGNFSQFNYQTIIDYVTSANLDTTSGSDTGYKRIRVLISSTNLPYPVQIESVRSNYR